MKKKMITRSMLLLSGLVAINGAGLGAYAQDVVVTEESQVMALVPEADTTGTLEDQEVGVPTQTEPEAEVIDEVVVTDEENTEGAVTEAPQVTEMVPELDTTGTLEDQEAGAPTQTEPEAEVETPAEEPVTEAPAEDTGAGTETAQGEYLLAENIPHTYMEHVDGENRAIFYNDVYDLASSMTYMAPDSTLAPGTKVVHQEAVDGHERTVMSYEFYVQDLEDGNFEVRYFNPTFVSYDVFSYRQDGIIELGPRLAVTDLEEGVPYAKETLPYEGSIEGETYVIRNIETFEPEGSETIYDYDKPFTPFPETLQGQMGEKQAITSYTYTTDEAGNVILSNKTTTEEVVEGVPFKRVMGMKLDTYTLPDIDPSNRHEFLRWLSSPSNLGEDKPVSPYQTVWMFDPAGAFPNDLDFRLNDVTKDFLAKLPDKNITIEDIIYLRDNGGIDSGWLASKIDDIPEDFPYDGSITLEEFLADWVDGLVLTDDNKDTVVGRMDKFGKGLPMPFMFEAPELPEEPPVETTTEAPEPEPETTTEAPEPEPETTTEAPEPEPETTTEAPEPEPETTTEAPEPEPETTTEAPEPEPETTTEAPEPEPETTTEAPEPEPETTTEAPEPEPETTTEAPEPEPETTTEAPEPEPETTTEAPEPEPETTIEAPEPEPETTTEAPEPETTTEEPEVETTTEELSVPVVTTPTPPQPVLPETGELSPLTWILLSIATLGSGLGLLFLKSFRDFEEKESKQDK